jgi:hypothetical protein
MDFIEYTLPVNDLNFDEVSCAAVLVNRGLFLIGVEQDLVKLSVRQLFPIDEEKPMVVRFSQFF